MNTETLKSFPDYEYGSSVVDWADQFLRWASQVGCSDIVIGGNKMPYVRLDGDWFLVSIRSELTHTEVIEILNDFRGQGSDAEMSGGKYLDFPYNSRSLDLSESIRYRVNASSREFDSQTCIEMTFRSIPSQAWELEKHEVDERLLEALFPPKGLVLIGGSVGSGKTTLIASVIKRRLQKEPIRIITYEDPIEYVHDSVENQVGMITHSEIPSNIKSFSDSIANSLRRAGDVVLLGESREKEAIKSLSILAETGVAVYTTLHTDSVAQSISRIVNIFDKEERLPMQASIIASTRVIVFQKLIKRAGGGRVALREFHVLTAADSLKIIGAESADVIRYIGEQMSINKTDVFNHLKELLNDGLITKETYKETVRAEQSIRVIS